MPSLRVVSSEAAYYPLKAGETLSVSVELLDELQAPIEPGASVGRVVWRLNGEVVTETKLISVGSADNNLWQGKNAFNRLFR